MDDHISQYLGQIRALLPIQDEGAAQYLATLEESILDYLSDNPEATFLEIEKRIGIPQEVAEDYLQSVDIRKALSEKEDDMQARLHTKRRTTISVMVLIFAITAIFFMFHLVSYIKFDNYSAPFLQNVNNTIFSNKL